MHEDNFNLRYYIALLFKRWYWIFLGGLVAALAALAVSLLLPKTYETTAAIAVVRSRTDVSFDDRIQTLEDYQLGDTRLAADRLKALLALADSNEVVRQVLEDVGDQLPASARRVNGLREIVDSKLTGDLLEFTARHEDPEVATAVVNSWAQAYVHHVNQIYGSSSEDVEAVGAQVVDARQTYEEAQQALQDFLADKEVLELTRTLERDLAIKQDSLDAYQESRVAIETNDTNTSRALLDNYYADLNEIEAWLDDAETLREQVDSRSGSFAATLGDALALIMLRGRVYGGQGPVDLQLDLANADIGGVDTSDVDNLIEVLETRREATEERIAALTAALGTGGAAGGVSLASHPLTDRIDALTDEIVDLETRLETEKARREAQRRELEATRDRTWQAYQALTAQQLELKIQAQSTGTEVRVADLAVVPEAPTGARVSGNTILAGIVGAFIALGGLLFLDWWSTGEGEHVQNADESFESAAYAPPAKAQDGAPATRKRQAADTSI